MDLALTQVKLGEMHHFVNNYGCLLIK